MRKLASRFLFSVLALGSASGLWAGTVTIANCQPDTLSNYIANSTFPTGGCAIGILDYYTFSYHPVSSAPLASDIKVGLSSTGTGFSFSRVDGKPITAAPGQTVSFEIDYNIIIDPAPIISGGDLSLDPPTGNVTITEYFCNDSVYVYTGTCFGGFAGAPETLTVGTIAPLSLTNTIKFVNPATRFQDVGILFTLIGGTTGSSFDSLDATATVITPEPASAATLLFGLAALGTGYKLRKRRSQSL